ncbi:MAG: hypothetical protein AAFP17_06140 [Pseudomonadota bacterium]
MRPPAACQSTGSTARQIRRAALALLLPLLAACAAGPTPYVAALPEEPASLGFREAPLEDRRFRISFAANGATAPEQVEDYLLYRAAEITLAEGADWFRIDARETVPEIRYFAGGYGGPVHVAPIFLGVRVVGKSMQQRPPAAANPVTHSAKRKHKHKRRHHRHRRYRRHSRLYLGYGFGFGYYPYGWGFYPGWGGTLVYRSPPRPVVTRLEASAEIRLFEGAKPADDAAAYDARAVIDAIGPRLLRPAAPG